MADQRIQYNEQFMGVDTRQNRHRQQAFLVSTKNDGTHKYEFARKQENMGMVTQRDRHTAAIMPPRLHPKREREIAFNICRGRSYGHHEEQLKVAGWNSAFKVADNVSTDAAQNISVFFSNQYLENISFEGVIFDLNGANNHTNASNYQMSAIMFSSD
jgi:hypothetical protein